MVQLYRLAYGGRASFYRADASVWVEGANGEPINPKEYNVYLESSPEEPPGFPADDPNGTFISEDHLQSAPAGRSYYFTEVPETITTKVTMTTQPDNVVPPVTFYFNSLHVQE